jgi:hypothetical protein
MLISNALVVQGRFEVLQQVPSQAQVCALSSAIAKEYAFSRIVSRLLAAVGGFDGSCDGVRIPLDERAANLVHESCSASEP